MSNFGEQLKDLQKRLDSSKATLLFTCGGTSGHINPALSVAEYIKQNYPALQIVFVGSPQGLERHLVEKAGYPFFALPARPFHKNPTALMRAVWTLARSHMQARCLIKALKPLLVFGTGGYVSAPLISAAKALHIKAALHEQNAFPGKSNLFLAKNIDLVCYSFPATAAAFSAAKRTELTGNPVPERFFHQDRCQAREELGLDQNGKYILVVGGSLGAKRLNDAVFELARRYRAARKPLPYHIILALGAKGSEQYTAEVQEYGDLIDCRNYIYDMEKYYAACDWLVCRAGALTLAEIAATGKMAIFVPYPYAAHDHQTYNARAFVEAQAALLCPDNELTADFLEATWQNLAADPQKVEEMGKRAEKLAFPQAAEDIAEALIELSGYKS